MITTAIVAYIRLNNIRCVVQKSICLQRPLEKNDHFIRGAKAGAEKMKLHIIW